MKNRISIDIPKVSQTLARLHKINSLLQTPTDTFLTIKITRLTLYFQTLAITKTVTIATRIGTSTSQITRIPNLQKKITGRTIRTAQMAMVRGIIVKVQGQRTGEVLRTMKNRTKTKTQTKTVMMATPMAQRIDPMAKLKERLIHQTV